MNIRTTVLLPGERVSYFHSEAFETILDDARRYIEQVLAAQRAAKLTFGNQAFFHRRSHHLVRPRLYLLLQCRRPLQLLRSDAWR